MKAQRECARGLLACCLAVAFAAAGLPLSADRLAAQLTPIQRDTTTPDSLRPDTVDQTKRYLEAQKQVNVRLNSVPLTGVDGPLPAMSRIVIDRDSIEWAMAETVGDLLQRVPGVYLWRGGFVGRPEYPNFQGRGATSAEYTLDGIPYLPLGPDSVGVDPSLFPLSFLSRIEIERWPGLLRVHLFTRRHDRSAPGSRIGITSGEHKFARYLGALERRYKSGLGFAAAVEFVDSPTVSGASSTYDNSHYWVQASYLPKPSFGVLYQMVGMKPDRAAFATSTDTIGAGLNGTRTDAEFRVFLGRATGGFGPRADLFYGRSHWDGDGVNSVVKQGGLVLSYRATSWGLELSGFNRSRWTPFDLKGSFGWAPLSLITLAAEAGYQTHDADRTSQWVGVRGGLRLPSGLNVSAAGRQGSLVSAPTILSDPAQDLTDLQLQVGWQRRLLGFEVGYSRTDAFRPLAYQPYLQIPTISPLGKTDWLTADVRLTPLPWLTFEGWYSDPRSPLPEGLPPTHSLSTATIRSKFWRTFPSGTFDFKLQGAMEAWSPGVIGRDSTGASIKLPGATFFRMLLEIQLQSFAIYWNRVNLRAARQTYVPGFVYPAITSTFGIRWEFTN